MIKITYQDQFGQYSVERNEKEFYDLYEIIDEAVIPILRAAGYSENTIKEVFKTDEEE